MPAGTTGAPERRASKADAGQAALEPAADAERALGEDADHATLPQSAERAAQRTDVGPLEADGDRADAVVEERMQRRGAVDARHHDERDRLGER